MTDRHHFIDYVELTVTDLDAAQAFYEAAFGWRFTAYGPGYRGFKGPSGDREIGGMATGEVKPGGPLVILWSDDLEASAAAVEAAGGTIVQPIFGFPGGRRFQFADPAGNQLAVWGEPAAEEAGA